MLLQWRRGSRKDSMHFLIRETKYFVNPNVYPTKTRNVLINVWLKLVCVILETNKKGKKYADIGKRTEQFEQNEKRPITFTGNSFRISQRTTLDIQISSEALHSASVVPDYWRGTRCRVELSQLSANIQKLVYHVAGKCLLDQQNAALWAC